MENIAQKADFLRNEYTGALTALDINSERKWGKMNVQQMIEHMSDYVRIASGRTVLESPLPEDMVARSFAFLETERPFRENTPNVLMSDTPPPPRHSTKDAAIAELSDEIGHFFTTYQQQPGLTVPNPFFGNLDYDHQVQVLHKHALHHLRQFGVNV